MSKKVTAMSEAQDAQDATGGRPEEAGPDTEPVWGWPADLARAVAFLTRLPVTAASAHSGDLARASRAFPLVGAAVGAAAGGVLWLAAQTGLPPLACALLALGAAALVTGALHEDGLADVADGLGGGRDREAKLRIMRDSRIGAFGVLALLFVVGLKAAALAGVLGPGWAALALISAHAWARGLMAYALHALEPARADGLGAAAGRPDRVTALTAIVLGAIAPLALFGVEVGGAMLLAGAGAAWAVAVFAKHQLGGASGDVFGALEQVAEAAVLLVAAAVIL